VNQILIFTDLQVVRWDLFGMGASKLFGKCAAIPLPPFLRPYIYKAYG
jgi:hypothetical protein